MNYCTSPWWKNRRTGHSPTTPLRICMDSSVRQPLLWGLNLNDHLQKELPGLADLQTVMLGMRKHGAAFTKDIFQFYYCVQADKQLSSVLLRFEDTKLYPGTFVTARVNYGDKPAGCIAIAAVWKNCRKIQ